MSDDAEKPRPSGRGVVTGRALIAAGIVLMATSIPAVAQGPCIPLAFFNAKVEAQFGEEPLATGRIGDKILRIYYDPDDLSFTIGILSEDRETFCLIATGDRFRPMIPEDLVGEPPVTPGKGKINITVVPKSPATPGLARVR